MVRAHSNPDPIAEVRLYLQGVAKYLADRLYGPAGPTWGTTLTQLEGTLSAVRQTLSEQLLNLALSRQAVAAPPEALFCPGCQRPPEQRPVEARVVTTDVGLAQWSEPHYFCRKCRKSFFPSVAQSRP
jgi:hypothetical protein